MNNQVILDLQFACANLYGIPKQNQIESWVQKIFSKHKEKIELTIRIVDIQEMLHLNWFYLGKNYPTNVLSFSFEHTLKIQPILLGDIIICKQIVQKEAQQNNIISNMHWAYTIIHGSLHLLGYDHITDTDNLLMNQTTENILQKLNF